jgi:CelD/BcsL family acetyltransferase involved in cellulose biosynthesis
MENSVEGAWTFEDYTDTSSFDRVREEWDELLKRSESYSFFQTPRWNALWWDHFGGDLELLLLLLRDRTGSLKGVAPFYLDRVEGGRIVAAFIGGLECSDYLDFIIERGSEKAFFEHLGEYLRQRSERPQLDLHFISEESKTLTAQNVLFDSPNLYVELKKEEVCPVLNLPSSWEEFLKGLRQKDRHELRRKMKRAASKGHLKVVQTSNPSDLSKDVDAFIELHRKSGEDKRNFMNQDVGGFFHSLAQSLLSEGRLALYFLLIDNIPVASLFGIRYGDGIAIYNSGFDPEWGYLSPGIVLFGHVIKEAIDEGCLGFDFLRGNENYKYRLGATDRWLYRMQIGLLENSEFP